MASLEAQQKTIADLFAAIRGLNVEAWLDCFASDASNIDPADAPAQTGHAAIRPVLEGAAQAFHSIHIVEDGVFIVGNQAAVKWTADFTMNGKTARSEGVDVIDFSEDGKIQTLRAFWNPTAMLAQLQN